MTSKDSELTNSMWRLKVQLTKMISLNLLGDSLCSYGISVGLGHIPAFLPYISDAGVLAPGKAQQESGTTENIFAVLRSFSDQQKPI